MRLIDAYRETAIEENMKTLETYKEWVRTEGMPMYFVRKKEETIEYLRTKFSENDFYSGKSYMNEEVIGTPEVKEDGYYFKREYYFETDKGFYRIYTYTPGRFTRWAKPTRLICTRIKKK